MLTPDIATVASPRAADLFSQAPALAADAANGDFDRILRDVSAAERSDRPQSDRGAADRGAADRAAADRAAADRAPTDRGAGDDTTLKAPPAHAASDAAHARNAARAEGRSEQNPHWRADDKAATAKFAPSDGTGDEAVTDDAPDAQPATDAEAAIATDALAMPAPSTPVVTSDADVAALIPATWMNDPSAHQAAPAAAAPSDAPRAAAPAAPTPQIPGLEMLQAAGAASQPTGDTAAPAEDSAAPPIAATAPRQAAAAPPANAGFQAALAATSPQPPAATAMPVAPSAPGSTPATQPAQAVTPGAQPAPSQAATTAPIVQIATADQGMGAALAPSAALSVQIAAAEPQTAGAAGDAPPAFATMPAEMPANTVGTPSSLPARPAPLPGPPAGSEQASPNASERAQTQPAQAPDAAPAHAAAAPATASVPDRRETSERFADLLGDAGELTTRDAPASTTAAERVDPAILPAADPARSAPAQADPVQAARAARAALPVAQQVSVHLTKAIADGVDRIEIRLTPVELGRVDVRLDIGDDGNVRAVFNAERPQTVELLQRDARELTRALQDSGLKADSGSLNFNLREQNRESQQGFAQRADRGNTNTDSGERPLATPRYAAPNGANGRLDIRV